MKLTIREERRDDHAAVRKVNEEAFARPQEARLVELLRANGGVLLSLVADVDGRVAGHILYSPVQLVTGCAGLRGAGLGPVAVLPEFQRQGVASKLIAAGNDRLRATGCPFVVVLGHAEFYPRFGFVAASRHGVRCQWDVPDEAFMLLPLDVSRMAGMAGLARYRDEFATVT